jgi:hypothetical protein
VAGPSAAREAALARLASLRLHQRNGHRSPHKPLLVLLALGRVDTTGSSELPRSEAESRLADLIAEAGYPFHCQPTRAPPAAADRLGRAAAYAGPKAGRPGVATVAATSAGPCIRPFRCESSQSSRQLGVRPRRRRRLAPESSVARRLAVKWIANMMKILSGGVDVCKEAKMNPKLAKWGVVGTVVALLVLTVLEIGFEPRSQANVSPLWLTLFLAVLITEIAAIPLIFKRPKMGAKFAIVAGALNITQIFADQLHLMQPEVAPLGYTLLEYSDGLVSIVLIYFAWKVRQREMDLHL